MNRKVTLSEAAAFFDSMGTREPDYMRGLIRSNSIIESGVMDMFQSRRSPEGDTWAPRYYGEWPLLIKSGEMFRGAMASFGATQYGAKFLKVRLQGPDYKIRHILGEGVPKRNFWGIRSTDFERIRDAIAESAIQSMGFSQYVANRGQPTSPYGSMGS